MKASSQAAPPSRIVLTGFMGSGKSTFGPLLDERIGDFAPIDLVKTQLRTAPPNSYSYAPTAWIRFANDSYELSSQ
jgi:polynucleotide 5'-kinase involved in rRNA processing